MYYIIIVNICKKKNESEKDNFLQEYANKNMDQLLEFFYKKLKSLKIKNLRIEQNEKIYLVNKFSNIIKINKLEPLKIFLKVFKKKNFIEILED